MEFRIGDRDPVTGLYDVIYPDGGVTRNGMKVFNAEHQFGDVVLATERSDGLMILDGVVAVDVPTPIVSATLSPLRWRSLSLGRGGDFSGAFAGGGGDGGGGVGYLNGQVFNEGEEVPIPTISIDFAPNSPTALFLGGGGSFVLRVALYRRQQKALKFRVDLSGVLAQIPSWYTLSEDLAEDVEIDAGQMYKDLAIVLDGPPVQAASSLALIATLAESTRYRIAPDFTSVVMASIPINIENI